MQETELIKVLLVDDDEDDFILTRGTFGQIKGNRYQVDWCNSYEAGLDAMIKNRHHIYLLDYRLGARDGIQLLKEAAEKGSQMPVIVLTGLGEQAVDMEAMKAGAADYLVKSKLEPNSLERSIRYALERKRAAASAAFEQASLAAFGADIGLALTKRETLTAILRNCAESMVRYLNVHLAQVWVLNPTDRKLDLSASAGAISHVPEGSEAMKHWTPDAAMALEGKPILLNEIQDHSNIPYAEWAKAEEIVAYAGYPLFLENRLIGMISIFSKSALSPAVLQEMGSVANGIALSIERKRSEEALDASEDKYRLMLESLKDVVFQVNEFGHWTALNSAWYAITGFEVREALDTLFLEFIHHDDRQHNSHIFLQLIERKLDYCRYETRLLTKDGKIRFVEVYAQRTVNPDGTVLGASGSFTDITERKVAERQIQKLAAFPQVNPNPILEFDADGEVTYFNEAAKTLATALGCENPISILPEKTADIVRLALATSEKRLSEEVTLGDRTISWSFFPVAADQVVHCYGVDITEIQNLEAQFRHAQKLESVGQLAAGVAHDFNNILTVIQGYSDHLLARNDGDPALGGPLKQISNAARRASALTRQLLMFSRKQVLQPRTVDVNSVLRNLTNMLTRLLGENITVETEYAAKLPTIEADTGMLEQVIMNLAVNSRDAMPRGGKLVVSTATVDVNPSYVQFHPEAKLGIAVCLSVTDNGTGMDRQTLARIFEPFFSTKEVGKGTGLGLATVYGIVKQHQGWIDVKSDIGTGTTFTIYLPANGKTEEAVKDNSATATHMAKGHNEIILLVEDEPILREWVKEILEGCDYRVLEAGTGVEALKVWDDQNGKIDLLLTDMVMPEGMTGGDLARQLKDRQPQLKVVYTSGYSAEVMGNDSGLPEGPFLPKPYPAPQLTQIVRDCLDSKLVAATH